MTCYQKVLEAFYGASDKDEILAKENVSIEAYKKCYEL